MSSKKICDKGSPKRQITYEEYIEVLNKSNSLEEQLVEREEEIIRLKYQQELKDEKIRRLWAAITSAWADFKAQDQASLPSEGSNSDGSNDLEAEEQSSKGPDSSDLDKKIGKKGLPVRRHPTSKDSRAVARNNRTSFSRSQKKRQGEEGDILGMRVSPTIEPMPIPAFYLSEVLSILVERGLIALTPYKPPSNDKNHLKFSLMRSDKTCEYHMGAPIHATAGCSALKHKLYKLINDGHIKFKLLDGIGKPAELVAGNTTIKVGVK